MKKLLLGISAMFSLIPGLAILMGSLGSPPGYNILFGGIIEAFGTLSLLILFLNSKKILRKSIKKVTKLAILFGILSFVSLITYLIFFSFCVVFVKDRGTIYYPIYTDGKIAEMINRAGSRAAAVKDYGIDAVEEAIDEMSGIPLALTTVFLLTIYQFVFTPLVLAFGFLGIRHKEELQMN